VANVELLAGINIAIEDRELDYVLVEVRASSFRFAGSTRAYLAPDRLSKLATQLSGFPEDVRDTRSFEFGSTDAGGYLAARFTAGPTGVGTVEVDIHDDSQFSAPARATFSFQVMAAALDEFVLALQRLGRDGEGSAELVGCERFSSPPP
jgi:hypothetical protein